MDEEQLILTAQELCDQSNFSWITAKDIEKLKIEEEKKFFQQQYKKNLNMKFQLETLGNTMLKLKQEQENLKDKLKEQMAKDHNNGYLFITINPKGEVEPYNKLHKFEKLILKFINRNFIEEAWAVIEQRGTTEEYAGTGYHAHIELRRNLNYRPSDIIKGAKNTFKSLCDTKNPALLNCQIHGEDFHKDKLEYIEGVKTGEGKDEKQEIDKIFRKNYNLQTVYNAQKGVIKETSHQT